MHLSALKFQALQPRHIKENNVCDKSLNLTKPFHFSNLSFDTKAEPKVICFCCPVKKERERGEAYIVDTLFVNIHANGAMLSFFVLTVVLFLIRILLNLHSDALFIRRSNTFRDNIKELEAFPFLSLLLVTIFCSFYIMEEMLCFKEFLTQLPMLTYLNDQ